MVAHCFFDNIDTEQKAYWLGFLTADGNVYGTRVQVNLTEKDLPHLQSFASDVCCENPIRHTVKLGRGETVYHGVALAFRSRHMVGSLGLYNVVPRKSAVATPWNGPAHLMRHYWRGLVDGDGWVVGTKRGLILGLCGTKAICEGFADFIEPVVGKRVVARPYRGIYVVVVAHRMARSVASLLYEGALRALPRKATKALSEAARTPKKTGRPGALSKEQQAEVRRLGVDHGVSEIAARFLVSAAVIHGILRRAKKCHPLV